MCWGHIWIFQCFRIELNSNIETECRSIETLVERGMWFIPHTQPTNHQHHHKQLFAQNFQLVFFRAQNTKDDTLNTPISVVCVHARIPTNMVCVCVCVCVWESVSVCLAVCLCFHNEILPAKLARLCACDVLLGFALEQTDKVEWVIVLEEENIFNQTASHRNIIVSLCVSVCWC